MIYSEQQQSAIFFGTGWKRALEAYQAVVATKAEGDPIARDLSALYKVLVRANIALNRLEALR